MPPRVEPVTIFRDTRGALIKAWPQPVHGEVYIVELLPGHERGHHRHHRGGEWFIPLQGIVQVVTLEAGKTVEFFEISVGERLFIPPGVAHALRTVNAPALLMAVADCAHPDELTTPQEVPWPCP